MGLLDIGTTLTDGMRPFNQAQALYLADALDELRPQVVFNGWGMDGYFSGRLLPMEPRFMFTRLTPPRLRPESQLHSGVDYWLLRHQMAPREVLDRLCRRDLWEIIEQVRELLAAPEARLREGALSNWDLAEAMLLPNLADVNPLTDLPAVDHLNAAETPAFDNEVIDAYLATPPALRHRHIAYARALIELNPAAARVPRTNTGVPVMRWPLVEHCAETVVYAGRVLRRRVLQRHAGWGHPARSWPHEGRIMATQPKWPALLRDTVRSSRMVQLGLVDRDVLDGIVEQHIARRVNHKSLLCTWLTLEVWLGQYEQAQSG